MSTVLPGQDTLIACWSALAETSPGARVHRSSRAVVATFPSWLPLNNTIVLDDDAATRSVVASERRAVCRRGRRRVGVVGGELRHQPGRARPRAGGSRAGARHDDARHASPPVSRAPPPRTRSSKRRWPPSSASRTRSRCPRMNSARRRAHPVCRRGRWWSTGSRWPARGPSSTSGLRHLRRRNAADLATQGVGAHAPGARARRRGTPGGPNGEPAVDTHGEQLYESLGFTPVGRYEEWVSH